MNHPGQGFQTLEHVQDIHTDATERITTLHSLVLMMWCICVQVNETDMSGKSQDDIVSLLRNVEVGSVVHLTVSRQTSDHPVDGPFDSTDSGHQVRISTSAPPSEQKEKQSNNGAGSPVLRCVATKTDENDNPVVDSNLELIELSIAVGEDDSSTSSGLGISIKGMSSGHEDLGLFIKKIIEGRAAAKVSTYVAERERDAFV